MSFISRSFFSIAMLLCVAVYGEYTVKDYSSLIGMQGFQDSLLKLHFTLYAGYVKNTNELLIKIRSMDPSSYETAALRRRLAWEFDGMRLHELYFENLGGNGLFHPESALYAAVLSQFQTMQNWKKEFIAAGMMRGIGWVVLYYDPQAKLLVNTWINEHDLGHLAGGVPILVMDVFEHAYMPQYGLDKARYIEAFFANIDWNEAASRFAKVSAIPK